MNDQITKRLLNNAEGNVTIDSVVNQISNDVASKIADQQTALENLQLTNTTKLKSGLYTGLNLEMDMMNQFFANYSLVLQSLTSAVDGFSSDPTCDVLRNKKECE